MKTFEGSNKLLLAPPSRSGPQPNIQGRAAAFIHETNWERIFDTSHPAVRARLLENTGALARG